MPQDTDWLTQQEIATMTGKEIREVREAVRNLRRAGVIQTTVSPQDERLILVHKLPACGEIRSARHRVMGG